MKKMLCVTSVLLCVFTSLVMTGCGDEENGGTLSVYVADAKPVLPVSDVAHVWVTFNECRIHPAGGEWISLFLANASATYTIDLLQFTNGANTALVIPADLDEGTYTQIRIGVKEAVMEMSDGATHPLEIPSQNLRTDKNIELDMTSDESISIVVDFDLSQSISAKGSGGYKLKPVLHVTKDPAMIAGALDDGLFGDTGEAIVVVYWDENADGTPDVGEEYTRLAVDKEDADTTLFKVFWVVPEEDYIVQIWVDDALVFEEDVPADDIAGFDVYNLNNGNVIEE